MANDPVRFLLIAWLVTPKQILLSISFLLLRMAMITYIHVLLQFP
jgi:hypothetical protein